MESSFVKCTCFLVYIDENIFLVLSFVADRVSVNQISREYSICINQILTDCTTKSNPCCHVNYHIQTLSNTGSLSFGTNIQCRLDEAYRDRSPAMKVMVQ